MAETRLYRRATARDIPTILSIRFAVHENRLSDPTKVTPAICEQYLDARGRGWVCEIDGGVVGFSFADRDASSIWAVFIHPEHEGRGIGKELLRLATEWLFESGSRAVTLTTSPGTRAEGFYRTLGWQPMGQTEDGDVAFRRVRSHHRDPKSAERAKRRPPAPWC